MSTFPHSIAALVEYENTTGERSAAWDCIETNADVAACVLMDEKAGNKVRLAFYEDTKHINSRENCLRISVEDVARIAGFSWKQKKKKKKEVAA